MLPLLGNTDSKFGIFQTIHMLPLLILILGFLTVCYHYWNNEIPMLGYFKLYVTIIRKLGFQCWDIRNYSMALKNSSVPCNLLILLCLLTI